MFLQYLTKNDGDNYFIQVLGPPAQSAVGRGRGGDGICTAVGRSWERKGTSVESSKAKRGQDATGLAERMSRSKQGDHRLACPRSMEPRGGGKRGGMREHGITGDEKRRCREHEERTAGKTITPSP